jgi:DNA-binding transcriptional LysR family regulator
LLKAFVTLAEKGNYADAAQTLAVSQPALTKQINLLESTINVALFSRGRQGTSLTAGGKRLLPEAEKVLKQAGLFLQRAEGVAKGEEGMMAVGFGLSSFTFAASLPWGKRFAGGSAVFAAGRNAAKRRAAGWFCSRSAESTAGVSRAVRG